MQHVINITKQTIKTIEKKVKRLYQRAGDIRQYDWQYDLDRTLQRRKRHQTNHESDQRKQDRQNKSASIPSSNGKSSTVYMRSDPIKRRTRRHTFTFALYTNSYSTYHYPGAIDKINKLSKNYVDFAKNVSAELLGQEEEENERYIAQQFINYLQTHFLLFKEHIETTIQTFNTVLEGKIPSETIAEGIIKEQWDDLDNMTSKDDLKLITYDETWLRREKVDIIRYQNHLLADITIKLIIIIPIFDHKIPYEVWEYKNLPMYINNTNSNAYVNDPKGKTIFIKQIRSQVHSTKTRGEWGRDCKETKYEIVCDIKKVWKYMNQTCLGAIFSEQEERTRIKCQTSYRQDRMIITQLNESVVYLNSPTTEKALVRCPRNRTVFTFKGPKLVHMEEGCVIYTQYGSLKPKKNEVEIKAYKNHTYPPEWLPIPAEELEEKLNQTKFKIITYQEIVEQISEQRTYLGLGIGLGFTGILVISVIGFLIFLYCRRTTTINE